MTFQPHPTAFAGLLATLPRSAVFKLAIADIDVSDRLRPVDPVHAEIIAASLQHLGQLQAVIVRRVETGLKLVVGAHRIGGAGLIGWVEIDAIEIQCSDDEARLIEIDENLARKELDALERAVFLSQRKRAYEALHPETANGRARKPKRSDPEGKIANFATFARFSKEAAESTGLSERAIQLACEIAGKLSPDAVALIRGSRLAATQKDLQELAELPPEQQIAIGRAVAEKRADRLAAARVTAGLVPAGGAVREADQPLARFIPILDRMKLQQLTDLRAMVDAEIAKKTPAAKPARAKKGGAE